MVGEIDCKNAALWRCLLVVAQVSDRRGEARLRADRRTRAFNCRARSPSARIPPAPAPTPSRRRWRRSPAESTQVSAKVQPYNGPNAWMPLLESGEIEFGIINILDSNMAATGTGNYKKAYPGIRVVAGGVFPFTAGLIVRDKSDIKQMSDLKGKRMAWDYGGHAINQTWQNAVMEASGLKPADVHPGAGVELERRRARRARRQGGCGVHRCRHRRRRRGQRHGAGALS